MLYSNGDVNVIHYKQEDNKIITIFKNPTAIIILKSELQKIIKSEYNICIYVNDYSFNIEF